jgi:hypothetical protein
MRAVPVSNRVNNDGNDDEDCSMPIKLAQSQPLLFS